VQHVEEAAAGHVLGDDELLLLAVMVADGREDVGVAELAEHVHVLLELVAADAVHVAHALHGDGDAVAHGGLVRRPEGAVAEHLGGRLHQVRQAEGGDVLGQEDELAHPPAAGAAAAVAGRPAAGHVHGHHLPGPRPRRGLARAGGGACCAGARGAGGVVVVRGRGAVPLVLPQHQHHGAADQQDDEQDDADDHEHAGLLLDGHEIRRRGRRHLRRGRGPGRHAHRAVAPGRAAQAGVPGEGGLVVALGDVRRDRAGKAVVGDVEELQRRGQLERDGPVDLVAIEVELDEARRGGDRVGRQGARDVVAVEVELLEPPHVDEHVGGERPGEGVEGQVQRTEAAHGAEARRQRAGEVVVLEVDGVEPRELRHRAEVERAGQVHVRQPEAGEVALVALDPGPGALGVARRRRRGRRPRLQPAGRVRERLLEPEERRRVGAILGGEGAGSEEGEEGEEREEPEGEEGDHDRVWWWSEPVLRLSSSSLLGWMIPAFRGDASPWLLSTPLLRLQWLRRRFPEPKIGRVPRRVTNGEEDGGGGDDPMPQSARCSSFLESGVQWNENEGWMTPEDGLNG
jgi:hypothetical protein